MRITREAIVMARKKTSNNKRSVTDSILSRHCQIILPRKKPQIVETKTKVSWLCDDKILFL